MLSCLEKITVRIFAAKDKGTGEQAGYTLCRLSHIGVSKISSLQASFSLRLKCYFKGKKEGVKKARKIEKEDWGRKLISSPKVQVFLFIFSTTSFPFLSLAT